SVGEIDRPSILRLAGDLRDDPWGRGDMKGTWRHGKDGGVDLGSTCREIHDRNQLDARRQGPGAIRKGQAGAVALGRGPRECRGRLGLLPDESCDVVAYRSVSQIRVTGGMRQACIRRIGHGPACERVFEATGGCAPYATVAQAARARTGP